MAHSFMARNIDLIIISIQSLDPYALDNLSIQSKILNIKELFLLRMENEIKYKSSLRKYTTYNHFVMLQEIGAYISQMHLQKNIINILEDLVEKQHNSRDYSLQTQNYIRRFIINYRKSIQPYLVGQDKYLDNSYVQKISIVNLFIVSELHTNRGIYFALLKTNSKEQR